MISCIATASYSVRTGVQKTDTSPKLALRGKHVAFLMERMHAVRSYSMVLGSLGASLRDIPNFQDTANKSNSRKLLRTNK